MDVDYIGKLWQNFETGILKPEVYEEIHILVVHIYQIHQIRVPVKSRVKMIVQ